jgi:hypothetical protein
VKLAGYVLAALTLLIAMADPAAAQQVTIDLGKDGGGFTERLIQLVALITILSIAPSILIMVTSFVRIVVVLSLLRTAIGIQQSPPNSVIVSLALFLTAFVMAPTFEKAYNDGIAPLMEEKIEMGEAFTKTAGLSPLRQALRAGCPLRLATRSGSRPRPPRASRNSQTPGCCCPSACGFPCRRSAVTSRARFQCRFSPPCSTSSQSIRVVSAP